MLPPLITYSHKALPRPLHHTVRLSCLACCVPSQDLLLLLSSQVLAGASQPHGHGFDVVRLHLPAGHAHSSMGGRGLTAPHAAAIAQPSHTHATGTSNDLDEQLHASTRPASAAQFDSGQAPLHPHQQMSGGSPQKGQHCGSPVGASAFLNPAADADAPGAACPQVPFGVFTSLASGTAFLGPAKVSQAARDRMSRFASDDLAAPAIQPKTEGPGESWQPSTMQQTDQPQHRLLAGSTAADSCPTVQFGVFTNLATGSHFARPSAQAVDAIRKMKGFVTEQPCGEPGHEPQQPQPGKRHQREGQQPGLKTAAGQAVMNLPPTATAAAEAPAFRIPPAATDPGRPTLMDPTGEAITDTTHLHVMHTATAAGSADTDAAGCCPPIKFGVFTNLKSGGMYAPPSKLSQHAKQRASEIFAAGTLDWPPPAAVATPPAAVATPAAAGKLQSTLQQPTDLQTCSLPLGTADDPNTSKHGSGTCHALQQQHYHQQQQQQQQEACSEARASSTPTEHQAGGDACIDRLPASCSGQELAQSTGKPGVAAAGVPACGVACTGETAQPEHACLHSDCDDLRAGYCVQQLKCPEKRQWRGWDAALTAGLQGPAQPFTAYTMPHVQHPTLCQNSLKAATNCPCLLCQFSGCVVVL